MNKLKQWAINHRLSRAVVTGFSGLLLLLTVACTAPNTPQASAAGTYNEQRGFQTELYDATQPKRGGMNGYDDDVKASSPEFQAKVRALVDTAKKNIGKTEDPRNIPGAVRQYAEELQDNVSESAARQKDELVKGTKDGMRNLKGNLDKASKEIPSVVKEATDNAKQSVQRSADSVKETASTLQRNVDQIEIN